MNNYNRCDICGVENKNVKAGRWIFYCPEHKNVDWQKTYENELSGLDELPDLDGELCEMIEANI